MKDINRNGLVRPHRPKIIALIRLFDIAIICLALQIILMLNQNVFNNHELWWILIAVTSFEFFAELNLYTVLPVVLACI